MQDRPIRSTHARRPPLSGPLAGCHELLRELVAQGFISQDAAEQALASRRDARITQQHPLEFIAHLQLDDLSRPGKTLDLENLTLWLAHHTGQPYLRIDPLKINVAEVTALMSYAFAQRHKILRWRSTAKA